jgi:hypothetical protein
VVVPCGRNWPVTDATPLPLPSAAVIGTVTLVPASGAGTGIEPVGAVLSTTRVSTTSLTLPAASVARARSSYEPSASEAVLSAHERGDVAPEHSVVHDPPAGRYSIASEARPLPSAPLAVSVLLPVR